MWEEDENGLRAECRVSEDDAVGSARRPQQQMTNGRGLQQRGMESGLLWGDDAMWKADGAVLPLFSSEECGEQERGIHLRKSSDNGADQLRSMRKGGVGESEVEAQPDCRTTLANSG